MSNLTDLEILDALGVEATQQKTKQYTAQEERIIAGFEDINNFVEEHGRAPQHGENNDIFERIYAVRLEQIRKLPESLELLKDSDQFNLLAENSEEIQVNNLSDDELLEALGVADDEASSLTQLKHVQPRQEKTAPDDIAVREPCKDFNLFEPLFKHVSAEIKSGTRRTDVITENPKVAQGDWFILFGQLTYVADFSEDRKYGFDGNDFRARVIYSNGTESALLLRSLQKALDRDETSRRVELKAMPLFDNALTEDDTASGILYVLRSKSEHPTIVENKNIIHKIGVTSGSVKRRITNAKVDPTYLMAEVEVTREYQLYNINCTKLEKLIHRFFSNAKLDIEIKDRFGTPISPREWFMVPLFVIDELVEKIREGSVDQYFFDTTKSSLERIK